MLAATGSSYQTLRSRDSLGGRGNGQIRSQDLANLACHDSVSIRMPEGVTLNFTLYDLLLWVLVGLVAGFLASRAMLGHGSGLVGDVVIGVIGAFLGNLLAEVLHIQIVVEGHPIVSQIIVALFGALILLLVVRLFTGRRRTAL